MDTKDTEPALGPWNPGIESTLPRRYMRYATLFRPENVSTSVAEAHEISDFSGIPPEELVAFRPERLVVHELLIRITADVSVPDGARYEDLGINFRSMARTLLENDVAPHMGEFVAAFDDLKRKVGEIVAAELQANLFVPILKPAEPPPPAGWSRWFGGGRKQERVPAPPVERAEDRDARVLDEWRVKARDEADPVRHAAFAALLRTAGAIHRRHGRLLGGDTLLKTLPVVLACNDYGSDMIGRMLDPIFREGCAREGYRLLPAQSHPVVMNVKGASASGKSTMRPMQKRLAAEIGVRWDEFALVSPDIWRKFLLDYDSLGEAKRYAGMLTGHELAIVDRKLDRYMALKGERGQISHLLIDRFRFDSFPNDPDKEDGSRLLTRFGDVVFMFFMITPPEETVERAWKRGLQFGRYKAVDDLLAHNVEAYNGMPRLFFTWVLRPGKTSHFEFLDNSVALGETPRTVAFGSKAEFNILDVKCIMNADRYAKLNINARQPGDVYARGDAMAPARNTQFLQQCARTLEIVNLAEQDTGRVYARLDHGKLVWWDADLIMKLMHDPDMRAGIEAVAPLVKKGLPPGPSPATRTLDKRAAKTLGVWGQHMPAAAAGG